MADTYYKVCAAWQDGTLKSAVAPPSTRVEYRTGSKTKPAEGCGPLAVFRYKAHAEAYWCFIGSRTHKVFECTAENVRVPPEHGKIMWSERDCVLACEYRPTGTLLADSVTLIREVTEKELHP